MSAQTRICTINTSLLVARSRGVAHPNHPFQWFVHIDRRIDDCSLGQHQHWPHNRAVGSILTEQLREAVVGIRFGRARWPFDRLAGFWKLVRLDFEAHPKLVGCARGEIADQIAGVYAAGGVGHHNRCTDHIGWGAIDRVAALPLGRASQVAPRRIDNNAADGVGGAGVHQAIDIGQPFTRLHRVQGRDVDTDWHACGDL